MLTPRPYSQFDETQRSNPRYFRDRWFYYQVAAGMAMDLKPSRAIEVGCAKFPILIGSYTVDIDPANGTDANWSIEETWPIPADSTDVVIALQVLEHLARPKKALAEMARVAKHAVVSIPYRWPAGCEAGHAGLTDNTMNLWIDGKWKIRKIIRVGIEPRMRAVYLLEK